MEGGALTLREMAEALNDMERDMTSWEADFHDCVLKKLRAKEPLTSKEDAKLREIYEKYLGPQGEVVERSDEEDDPDGDLDL